MRIEENVIMIRVRIEGTEEEMLEFMEKMPDIPGFEKNT